MDQEKFLQQFSTVEQQVLRVGWLEQRGFARDLAGFGLTPPQFFVLRAIALHDAHPTMKVLADDTLQHCATLTGVVDRLVRMGLVTRHRDARDRRQVLVELTESGGKVLEEVRRSHDMRVRDTLARLSPRHAADLLRLLKVYLEAFRAQGESSEDAQHDPLAEAQVGSRP